MPKEPDGLRRALGEAHRRYTRRINFRESWRGHLWQERFHSFPMDEAYLLATARYVELNPVRARLVRKPQNWPWSSARAHLAGRDDALVQVAPLLRRVPDWARFLAENEIEEIRKPGRKPKEADQGYRENILSAEFGSPGTHLAAHVTRSGRTKIGFISSSTVNGNRTVTPTELR